MLPKLSFVFVLVNFFIDVGALASLAYNFVCIEAIANANSDPGNVDWRYDGLWHSYGITSQMVAHGVQQTSSSVMPVCPLLTPPGS